MRFIEKVFRTFLRYTKQRIHYNTSENPCFFNSFLMMYCFNFSNFVSLFVKMKKYHILFLMFMLGFFLMPGVSYGCETKIEKSCCKKESKARSEQKDCCKKSKESKEEPKNCGGKCGHSNCTASSMQFSLLSGNEIEIKSTFFDFTLKKPDFHHNQTTLSSGFYSVWSPPKIS